MKMFIWKCVCVCVWTSWPNDTECQVALQYIWLSFVSECFCDVFMLLILFSFNFRLLLNQKFFNERNAFAIEPNVILLPIIFLIHYLVILYHWYYFGSHESHLHEVSFIWILSIYDLNGLLLYLLNVWLLLF